MEDRKSPIGAIFFDLDNTLLTTRKSDEQACDKLMEILHRLFSVPPEIAFQICKKYLKLFRKCPENSTMDLHEWRKILWKKALGENYASLTGDIYHQWLDLRYKHLSLSPEIRNLLKTLGKQYLLALITNGPSNAQWEKVNKLNLIPFFNVILVSGDLPWEKPHPKIFLQACHNLNIKPHQAVMVGDKLDTDIAGSINSKLGGSIWVPLGDATLKENGPVPDFILNNVMELKALMSKISMMKSRFSFQLSDIEDSNSNSSDGS